MPIMLEHRNPAYQPCPTKNGDSSTQSYLDDLARRHFGVVKMSFSSRCFFFIQNILPQAYAEVALLIREFRLLILSLDHLLRI
jgi:hypothetical protein